MNSNLIRPFSFWSLD